MTKFKPAQNIVAANDKITKNVFALSQDEYFNSILENAATPIKGKDAKIPKEGGKRGEKISRQILSYFWLNFVKAESLQPLQLSAAEIEYLIKPLNIFDRLVLTACESERAAGNKEISVAVVYRAITGKIGANSQPTKDIAEQILMSIKKLACVQVRIDISDACRAYKNKDGSFVYNEGKPYKSPFEPILPCRIDAGSFYNHNPAQIISLTGESPLYKLENIKKQLLTFPRSVLSVLSGIYDGKRHYKHFSAEIASVAFYTAVRAFEIEGTAHLTDVITYSDVFKKCGITSKDIQATARDAMAGILENIKTCGRLKNFEVIRDGAEYKKINLTYPPKKKIVKNSKMR